MSDEVDRHLGISRRDLMKRGAVAGAVVWATPVVQSFATPAFASEGTPVGDNISYVAFCYTCDGGATHCRAKYETDGDTWEFGTTFETPFCDFSCPAPVGECGHDAGDFLVTETVSNGDVVVVTIQINPLGDAANCTIHEGSGVGMCGGPVGECVDGLVTPDGKTITFEMCDVNP